MLLHSTHAEFKPFKWVCAMLVCSPNGGLATTGPAATGPGVGEGGSQPAKPSTLVPTGASAATSTHQLQQRTSFKCLQAGDGFVKEEYVNGGKQGGQQHIVC